MTFCEILFNIILDLALCLNNDYEIKPVLNVNLVFNEYGLIGSRETISRLIQNSLQLKKIKSNRFVMFFDYERYDDDLNVREIYDKLNNQYVIGDDDFPQGELLKELEYNKIAVFTRENIKEDLKVQLDFVERQMEVEIIGVN